MRGRSDSLSRVLKKWSRKWDWWLLGVMFWQLVEQDDIEQ
jgi:hypothetical protein